MEGEKAFPVTVASVGASFAPCSQGASELSDWDGSRNYPSQPPQPEPPTIKHLVSEPLQPAPRPRTPQPDQG